MQGWIIEQHTTSHSAVRLNFIDGLRGIAVLMVVLSHTSQGLGSGTFRFPTIAHYVSAGDRGVQLFFILSAFTLFMTSLRRYKSDNKPLFSFYIRRSFRILPFWWLITIFWTAYYAISPHIALLSATFLFGFFRFNGNLEFIPGGWTLFVEETFYLFLPLIRRFITSLWYAVSLFIVLLSIRELWLFVGPKITLFQTNNFVVLAPPAQWFAFGLGIIVYFLYVHDNFRNFLGRKDIYFLVNLLAIYALIIFLGENVVLSSYALTLMCIAAFLPTSIFGRLSRLNLLGQFGRRCYSIYLLQFIVLLQLNPIAEKAFSNMHLSGLPNEVKLAIYFPIVCFILYILSFITYRIIEAPCISAGAKIINWLNTSKLENAN